MFIKTSIEPRDINLYKLTVNQSINNEVPLETLKSGYFIETDNIMLKFNRGQAEESSLSFSIVDK